ncbi:EAL domain-containing protein [Telmatospirillum siberiense]|uniref:EAL domain-containing protein n=1 Tax=Telmatospirillum siberiense TaxID=382514 RepID=A0A2N3PWU0_9PROT|nr:EAL domain-containing protein [Telmatospirillum siberiense]PKU24884.1 EAL domain-containing protein [Telmatospirillum siberiense]
MNVTVRRSRRSAARFDRLLAYFDRWQGHPSNACRQMSLDEGVAVGRFDDLRLHSAFQPLFEAGTMRPMAYEALLRAQDVVDKAPVSPAKAFAYPVTSEEIIYFDRLCRMVHVVNFVRQASPREYLFLNVDGRQLLNVGGGDHGSAFETLLQYCGLKPTQVVLEIVESRIDDLGRLVEAVSDYQQRGYRVAIDDFGCQDSNFDRLWQLSPDFVKLDRSLVVQSMVNPRARLIFPKLVEIIHDLEAQVVCEGIETPDQHDLAISSGVDLLQGYYYARPHPSLLRPEPLQSR